MPFTLSITFSGLCLLATDTTDADTPCFHALLLRSDLAEMETHLPRLMFDAAHCSRTSAKAGSTSHLVCYDLTNGRHQSRWGTMPIDFQSLPPEIARVDTISPVGSLDPSYVSDNVADIALTQITMFKGLAAEHGAGALFVPAPPNDQNWPACQLTNWIKWSVAGISTKDSAGNECYTLDFAALDPGTRAPESLTLYPIDNAIDLVMVNGTPGDLVQGAANPTPAGSMADHFVAYYKVFELQDPTAEVVEVIPMTAVDGTYADDSVIAHKTGGDQGAVTPCYRVDEGAYGRPKPWLLTLHTVTCITGLVDVG